MIAMLVFGGLALLGHGAMGVAVFNRMHSFGLPYRVMRTWDLLWCVWLLAFPVAAGYLLHSTQSASLSSAGGPFTPFGSTAARHVGLQWGMWLLQGYFWISQCILVWIVVDWLQRTWVRPHSSPVQSNHTTRVNLAEHTESPLCGRPLTRWLAQIPGNQILDLHVHEKCLVVPHLPPAWEGLRVAHLSDLHMTGQLTIDFFHHIVERTNQARPDLIAVTGDIVDKQHCLEWIGPTLGRLAAPLGSFFVLGNHDGRLKDVNQLRQVLEDAGLQGLGGCTAHRQRGGIPLVLVGNELPWLPRVGTVAPHDRSTALTIALAHTPDQIEWARRQGAHLLLAGHTHGGQFQIPGLGPVLSPSRYGVRYASGTFWLSPTVMHVSRGLSGTRQLRFRCPPELALLTLTAGATTHYFSEPSLSLG